jgi:hypothetical protein
MGAGATLVAIIGGLLVTRYITLESQLQAANERLLSTEARLDEVNTALAEAQTDLRNYRIAAALENPRVFRTLIAAAAANEARSIEVSTFRGLADLKPFTDDQLSPVLDAWLEETKYASAELSNSFPKESPAPEWTSFSRGRQLPIRIEQVWAGVYDILASRREIDRARSSIYDAQEEQRLVRLVDQAHAAAVRLTVETEAAHEARSMISRPPGLAVGLVVLAVLTCATVVPSLLLLAPTPATLSYGEGAAIVALFLAAVVLLFGYMVFHVYRLRKLSSDGRRQPSDTAVD